VLSSADGWDGSGDDDINLQGDASPIRRMGTSLAMAGGESSRSPRSADRPADNALALSGRWLTLGILMVE
jgi:hypothetical protein